MLRCHQVLLGWLFPGAGFWRWLCLCAAALKLDGDLSQTLGFDVRFPWREDLRKTAGEKEAIGKLWFAKAKEVSIGAADNGQHLMFGPGMVFPHQNDAFFPVEVFRRHDLFGRFGADPRFHSRHASRCGVRNAEKAGHGNEGVLVILVCQCRGDRHAWTIFSQPAEYRMQAVELAELLLREKFRLSQELVKGLQFSCTEGNCLRNVKGKII